MGIDPTRGRIITYAATIKGWIYPSIPKANSITNHMAVKIPIVIRSFPSS